VRFADSCYYSLASFIPFIRLKPDEELKPGRVRLLAYVSLILTIIGAILIPLALAVFTGLVK
jgi:hypothetical protein